MWGSVVRHFPDSRIRRAVAAAGLLAAAAHGADEPRLTWTSGSGEPAWSASVSGPAGEEPREPPGPLLAPAWFEPAPDVTVDLVGGGRFRLSEQRGKVVVLDFWASWCAPCLRELPELQKLWEERSPSGRFAAVAVNVREGEEIVDQAVRALDLGLPVGRYDARLEETFRVRALPDRLLVDGGGRVRVRWSGSDERPGGSLAERVAAILGDDPEGAPRRLGDVVVGPARFAVSWARDLDSRVEGLAASVGSPGRVLASLARRVLALGEGGATVDRIPLPSAAGRLLLADLDGDGLEEAVSFRPGASEILAIDLRGRTARALEAPEPALDVVAWPAAPPGAPAGRLVLAAQSGVLLMDPASAATRRVEGAPETLDVASAEDGSVAALGSDRALRWISRDGAASAPVPLPGGDNRIAAAAGPETGAASARATATAVGRFCASAAGRQVAIATPGGDLSIHDIGSGTVLWRARWQGIRHLASADVDGDGRDELFVASGRTVALLEEAP